MDDTPETAPRASIGSTRGPAEAVFGERSALMIGAALVVALAALTCARWLGSSSSGAVRSEEALQVPVPPDAYPSQQPDRTAPDPGDTP